MEFPAFKKYPSASGQDDPFTFGPKKKCGDSLGQELATRLGVVCMKLLTNILS